MGPSTTARYTLARIDLEKQPFGYFMHQIEQEETFTINALREGDREAFAAMVDLYSPPLYRLVMRMLGNPQEAEDALQETFLQAFRNINQFEGRSRLSTWLYRIATNQALMKLRKREPDFVSVDEPIETTEGGSLPRQLRDWCCLPEQEFMSSEASRHLDHAIQELSPALRAAFILRDLQEFSTREAAEILEISESAVKTRLLRARLELRERLSDYFGERLEAVNHE
jgi:RNA polymerase sigma-70 factor (ECF subfamily)